MPRPMPLEPPVTMATLPARGAGIVSADMSFHPDVQLLCSTVGFVRKDSDLVDIGGQTKAGCSEKN